MAQTKITLKSCKVIFYYSYIADHTVAVKHLTGEHIIAYMTSAYHKIQSAKKRKYPTVYLSECKDILLEYYFGKTESTQVKVTVTLNVH